MFGSVTEIEFQPDNATGFDHSDHLGSTRVVTLSDKTVNDVMDYLPFGEQLQGNSGTTHKFTGYERDAESNLDYASARHYSSAEGRFMTPDPAGLAAVSLTTPQSLNQYAYGLGNPMTFIDPSGLDASDDDPSACDGGGYSDPNFGLGDGYGGVYLGGPIWNEQVPVYSGPNIDPRLIIQNLTNGAPAWCPSGDLCDPNNGLDDEDNWWAEAAKHFFTTPYRKAGVRDSLDLGTGLLQTHSLGWEYPEV